MSSRGRVLAALAHRTPDAVPIDLGATPVTGVHVSCVAALRDYYGLEKRPVKVHEPYQLLGLLEEDLKQAIGVDVEGVPGRETLFGFRNDRWKPWKTPDGLEVLVSEDFNTTTDANGASTRSSARKRSTRAAWIRPTISRSSSRSTRRPSTRSSTTCGPPPRADAR
jgi:hypothetical protein